MPYQAQDKLSEIYDGTALVADGDSAEVNFYLPGGCPDAEIALKIGDRETGESVSFLVKDYYNSSWVTRPQRLHAIALNGEYILPINNRIILGSKMKLSHDVTLPTGSDGITVHGHVRPRI